MTDDRSLDIEIAERIFGYTLAWMVPDHAVIVDSAGNIAGTVPHYSTDIADAWRVVEKMRINCAVHLYHGSSATAGWTVQIDEPPSRAMFSATEDTAPLAICRAALAGAGR